MGSITQFFCGVFTASLICQCVLVTAQAGEGEVKVITWTGYIERGDNDKSYDWVSGFEQKTGCKVKVTTASSSDEMVNLMKRGEHDLVTASGDASYRLIAAGLVQPVNLKRVRSWPKVDKRLRNASWHTVDGVHFGVPYQWGPNVLMYNTQVFRTPPESWGVVFNAQALPDGKPNQGRIQAYYGPIYVADAALYLMKSKPALGIRNPYELDEAQYAATLALLRGQQKIVRDYWRDAEGQVTTFKGMDAIASQSWPYQVNALKAAKQPVKAVIPKEGATGWADSTMLHAEARNVDCAYQWIEHSLSPVVQGDVAAWFGSNPVVMSACKESALLATQGCDANWSKSFDRIWFWRTPVADCGGGRRCVPYARWVSDFAAIKNGR